MVDNWSEDYCRFLIRQALEAADLRKLWEVSLSITGIYQDEDIDNFMSLYRRLIVKYCGIQEGDNNGLEP